MNIAKEDIEFTEALVRKHMDEIKVFEVLYAKYTPWVAEWLLTYTKQYMSQLINGDI